MSQSDYTLVLPAFTIGANAYDAIGQVTKPFGKKVVIIGGKTALSKAEKPLLDAIKNTDLEVLGVLWYGDDATYERVDALMAEDAVKNADLIFGVGGGRAIYTCKVVADKVGKPYFAFPTVASNCAPSTAIAVMYNEDKSFAGYYYLPTPPVHTFINMDIIADSPFDLFWAGNGFTICTGSLGANRQNDIPHIIRKFGKMGRVNFLHIRNVQVHEPWVFNEVAHKSQIGNLDMFEIVKAAYDIGFDGPIRPDHGRMIWGEEGRPGYGLYDRALGANYLCGLWDAINRICGQK